MIREFFYWLFRNWFFFVGVGDNLQAAMADAHEDLVATRGRMNYKGKPRKSIVVRVAMQRVAGRLKFAVIVKERF